MRKIDEITQISVVCYFAYKLSEISILFFATAWFIAVQTLMTFAVVFAFVGLAVVPMAGRFNDTITRQKMACFVTLMSSECETV